MDVGKVDGDFEEVIGDEHMTGGADQTRKVQKRKVMGEKKKQDERRRE